MAALQLPSSGLTVRLLSVLAARTDVLECLKLPPSTDAPLERLNTFVAKVAGELTSFAVGGAADGGYARVPSLLQFALPHIVEMSALRYLDLSGCRDLGDGVPQLDAALLRQLLQGKKLTGLAVGGCANLSICGLLDCSALRGVEYLDLRDTRVRSAWFHVPHM